MKEEIRFYDSFGLATKALSHAKGPSKKERSDWYGESWGVMTAGLTTFRPICPGRRAICNGGKLRRLRPRSRSILKACIVLPVRTLRLQLEARLL